MRNTKNIFCENNSVRGNILIELLLSVALAVVAIPFIFRYQQDAVIRAQNIAITNQMTEIQVALERYIVANRTELLRTVGRSSVPIKWQTSSEASRLYINVSSFLFLLFFVDKTILFLSNIL